LLGVGQDATDEGRTTGTQVSLFDVSDLASPTRLHAYAIDAREDDRSGSSSSEVEWDARAFLHWAPTGLTVIPVQRWSYDDELGGYFAGAIGLRIDAQDGISELGRLTHQRGEPPREPENGIWSEELERSIARWYEAGIRRSVVVGDTLYTISDTSVLASDLDTLAEIAFIDLS
jgi:hypothetical protein